MSVCEREGMGGAAQTEVETDHYYGACCIQALTKEWRDVFGDPMKPVSACATALMMTVRGCC